MAGKTIQIFLPDGNPRGVRLAEITNRTLLATLLPRAQLEIALARDELQNVGVYFLLGDSEGAQGEQLYIGEAEDCAHRLRQHNKGKDWWTDAIGFVSRTSAFTKVHVKYLEWMCHQKALKAGRYIIENAVTPTKPHVSEPMIADLDDYFETIQTLSGALGYPVFDDVAQPQEEQQLLTCQGKDAKAKGEYTEDGLVVLAGSISNAVFTKSSHQYARSLQAQLIANGVLAKNSSTTYEFTKNHAFSSPSTAAQIVLARNANGWTEWKFNDGRTMDDVYRQSD